MSNRQTHHKYTNHLNTIKPIKQSQAHKTREYIKINKQHQTSKLYKVSQNQNTTN